MSDLSIFEENYFKNILPKKIANQNVSEYIIRTNYNSIKSLMEQALKNDECLNCQIMEYHKRLSSIFEHVKRNLDLYIEIGKNKNIANNVIQTSELDLTRYKNLTEGLFVFVISFIVFLKIKTGKYKQFRSIKKNIDPNYVFCKDVALSDKIKFLKENNLKHFTENFNIKIRNADSHLLYKLENGKVKIDDEEIIISIEYEKLRVQTLEIYYAIWTFVDIFYSSYDVLVFHSTLSDDERLMFSKRMKAVLTLAPSNSVENIIWVSNVKHMLEKGMLNNINFEKQLEYLEICFGVDSMKLKDLDTNQHP